jgi:phosphoglycerol transferase MdoB-like AlkP superfamily enzyme
MDNFFFFFFHFRASGTFFVVVYTLLLLLLLYIARGPASRHVRGLSYLRLHDNIHTAIWLQTSIVYHSHYPSNVQNEREREQPPETCRTQKRREVMKNG